MAVVSQEHAAQKQVPPDRCLSKLPGSFMRQLLGELPSADRLSLFQSCSGLRDQVLQHASNTILALVFEGQRLNQKELGLDKDYMAWPHDRDATMVHSAKACELCMSMHLGVRPHHITLQVVQQGACHSSPTAPSEFDDAESLIRDMSEFLQTRLYCITEVTLQGVVLNGVIPLWLPGTCPNLQQYHVLGCRMTPFKPDEQREWRPQCLHLTHFTLHSTIIPRASLDVLQRELMLLPSVTTLDITVSPTVQEGLHKQLIVSAFGSRLRQLRAAGVQAAFPGPCVNALKLWGQHLACLTTLDIGNTIWAIGQEEASLIWGTFPELKHLTVPSFKLTAPVEPKSVRPPPQASNGQQDNNVHVAPQAIALAEPEVPKLARIETICVTMPLLHVASLQFLPIEHLKSLQLLPDKRLAESEPSLTVQFDGDVRVLYAAICRFTNKPLRLDTPGISQLRLSSLPDRSILGGAELIISDESWKQLTCVQLRNMVFDDMVCSQLCPALHSQLKRLRLYDVTFNLGYSLEHLLPQQFSKLEFLELRGSSMACAPKECLIKDLFKAMNRPLTLLVQSSWRKRVEAGLQLAAPAHPIKLLFTDSNTYW